MIIPCTKAIDKCLPCDDDPLLNLSTEDEDTDRYIGEQWPIPPSTPICRILGTCDPFHLYYAWGCTGICFSTASQEDANLCAANQSIECIDDDPGCVSDCGKGGVTPFHSDAQSCSVGCATGTFTFYLAAGSVLSFFSRADANARAKALACKMAGELKLCLKVSGSTNGCKGSPMSFTVTAIGKLTQTPLESNWTITGPGIDVNLLSYPTDDDSIFGTSHITISGTPTISTDSYVIVRITDNNTGVYMELQIPISVGEISTSSPMPDGESGTPYSETISETGLTEPLSFSVSSGSMPTGLTLNESTGEISGTPTSAGVYNFTIAAEDSSRTCTKALQITINAAACAYVDNLRVTGFTTKPDNLTVHFNYTGPALPSLPTITWQRSTDGISWTTIATNTAAVGDNARAYTGLASNTVYYIRVLLSNCASPSNTISQKTWPSVILTDLGDCLLACGGELPGNLNIGLTVNYSFDNPFYGALGLVSTALEFQLNTCQGIFTKVRAAYPSADALPEGLYINTSPEPDACVMSCTLVGIA